MAGIKIGKFLPIFYRKYDKSVDFIIYMYYNYNSLRR